MNPTRKQLNWAFALILFLAFVAGIFGQTVPEYRPNENQSLRLMNRQQAITIARLNYQGAVGDLVNEAEKIRKENSWPSTVSFDLQAMQFVDSKPAEKPKEAPKPEKKP